MMPDKHGSNRYGWNQRGGTNKQLLENARYQSEILNPDSRHWENKTWAVQEKLVEKMGAAEFEAWAERLFPGDSIDDATWKEIFELYQAKFDNLIGLIHGPYRGKTEVKMIDDGEGIPYGVRVERTK